MIGIDWLKLLIANAAPESQERVCRILHHASIQPLGMQYALGQERWTTDLFDSFPQLDIHDLNSLNNCFSQYRGICHTADATWVYEGSATSCAMSPDNQPLYPLGEARRMYHGHRNSLKKTEPPLFIHRLMMTPQSESFFISSVRFPIMQAGIPRAKVQTLTILSEIMSMILLGTTLPERSKPEPVKSYYRSLARMSQLITAAVRPKDAPIPPWRGANKLLPLLQHPLPVYALIHIDPSWSKLKNLLIDHWEMTQAQSLGQESLDRLIAKVGMTDFSVTIREDVQDAYRQITATAMELKENRETAFAIKLFLWVALIQHAEAFELVSGPVNGAYILNVQALDWTEISRIARSLVKNHPDPDFKSYWLPHFSKYSCFKRFSNPHQADRSLHSINGAFLYKSNWDRLRGELRAT